ncbi:MAG TPA: glycosyl hydrolase, partial [Mycobacteriales bacterium]|nr:glycosyl hydrolase [Mycobacteriales bacterium]
WLLLALAALAVVVVVGGAIYRLTRPVHHFAKPGPNTGWLSGVYAGHSPADDEAFAKWRGAAIQVATDFVGGGAWESIEHPLVLSLAWRKDYAVQLVVSVPMWPATGGSLSDAAAGDYNSNYAQLAKTLVSDGRANSVIRLGWEFNTPYFRWQVASPQDAALYAVAWRQAVTSMRSVSGAKFTFVWNPNLSNDGPDPALAYPGDTYVDDIGLDVYDRGLTGGETPAQRWNDLVHQRYGLAWQASFAARHDKPIAFPEWGLVHDPGAPIAGGDDPYFIQQMHAWFASHRTAFEVYFDGPQDAGSTFAIGDGSFPKAAALYLRLFGGGH